MTSEERLGAASFRQAMVVYRDLLRSHREVLNRLNVYPVPDGDTGTNMALTLDAVVTELEQLDERPTMEDVCKAISHGSLMGARGNSGVILSQLLRGLGERLGPAGQAGSSQLAGALSHAGALARQAVVRPVEGTILTVASAAAEAAERSSDRGAALVDVVENARQEAGDTLERTPEMLPELARAGVVDAGAAGFVLLLDALLVVLDGRVPPEPAASELVSSGPSNRLDQASRLHGGLGAPGSPGTAARAANPGTRGTDTAHGSAQRPGTDQGEAFGDPRSEIGDLRYEVMYLLEAPDTTIPAFKEVWAGIGDSIVVVGGSGLWNCHIHTPDIGAAIEAGLDAGRPRDIRVTDLLEQVEEERWVREGAGDVLPSEPSGPPPTTAVVAVVNGVGVGRIFRSLGAFRQVQGGQTLNPSTGQLADAVQSTGSQQVVILPNNSNIRAVAEQVQALTSSKSVAVVPTGSIVEGFAALLAYDPGAGVEENARAMSASASRVVPAEITHAIRDAETPSGKVNKGDWIGLSRDGVIASGESLSGVVTAVLERLVKDDHELITIIEGEGATAADTRRVTEWVHDRHPTVSVEVHHGGQPLYPYLLGIE